MNIENFDDLLAAARQQPEAQRLLFVFAGAELPEDATAGERAGFEAGTGGALVPLMCVDKALAELDTFDDLARESEAMGVAWRMVFAAALAGRAGRAPTAEDARQPLERMVESIRLGQHQAYIPFDRQGQPVQFG